MGAILWDQRLSHPSKATTRLLFKHQFHLPSVELGEWSLQIVLTQIRRRCYKKEPQLKLCWVRSLPRILSNPDSRLLRIHGYILSLLLFNTLTSSI